MRRPYRLKNIYEGFAEVWTRDGKTMLGHVKYREKSYNLRRYFVARWWEAHRGDLGSGRGTIRRDGDGKPFQFGSRDDAARGLVIDAKKSLT